MKKCDFLSEYPSIYLSKEKRGKNALGGFFSIVFALVMIAIAIYYLYIYYFGLEYNVIFYRDIWYTAMDEDQKKSILTKKSFFLAITDNSNNATIIPILIDKDGNMKPAEKCKYNVSPDLFTNDNYCFDLSFPGYAKEGNFEIGLFCENNCVKKNGELAEISISFMMPSLKIDHSKENPFIEKGFYGLSLHLTTRNNILVDDYEILFNIILYKSSNKSNKKTYFDAHLEDFKQRFMNYRGGMFARFYIGIGTYTEIYERKYRTLLDTLSKIGGLFSPLKLIFGLLISYYSDFQIKSTITKNVFSQIKNYKSKQINFKNNINNINNNNVSDNNTEFKKKFNINKIEQLFSCLKICKNHRSMRILNLCSDFVQTYLSAENIIFNMILFESYYKNNPIKYNTNSFLNKIDKEIESEIVENKNDVKNIKNNENDKKEELISLFPNE